MTAYEANNVLEAYKEFYTRHIEHRGITYQQFIDIVTFYLFCGYVNIREIEREVTDALTAFEMHDMTPVTDNVLRKMSRVSDIKLLMLCDVIDEHRKYGVIGMHASVLGYCNGSLDVANTFKKMQKVIQTDEYDTLIAIEKRLAGQIITRNEIRPTIVNDTASSINFGERFGISYDLDYTSTIMLAFNMEFVKNLTDQRISYIADKTFNKLKIHNRRKLMTLKDIIYPDMIFDEGVGYFTLFSLLDTDFKDRTAWPFSNQTIEELVLNKLEKFNSDSGIWGKLKLFNTGYSDKYVNLTLKRTALLSILYHTAEYVVMGAGNDV